MQQDEIVDWVRAEFPEILASPNPWQKLVRVAHWGGHVPSPPRHHEAEGE